MADKKRDKLEREIEEATAAVIGEAREVLRSFKFFEQALSRLDRAEAELSAIEMKHEYESKNAGGLGADAKKGRKARASQLPPGDEEAQATG